MIKVAILGAGGRMGSVLIRLMAEERVPGLSLVAAVDWSGHPALGDDSGTLSGVGPLQVPLTCDAASALEAADVAIDFSMHTATAEHAKLAQAAQTPLVIGTTGLEDAEKAVLKQSAESLPIVWAPNMSLGMNVLFALSKQVAAALKGRGYDVEIIERHHRRKKDAPSGTALRLGEAVAEGLEWDLDETAVHGREGLVGERPEKEIGFHAVRGGDFVGDHTVVFAAEGESVEIHHRATDRATFATGALQAASWVVGQKPGLYSMFDVLGLQG